MENKNVYDLKSVKLPYLAGGVPVAVKDEIDMTPYPTTVGTAFLGKTPAKEDATVVARLRSAGALPGGESDLTTTIEIMRFTTVANMTGLPAISFPVGYTQL
ncbi:MAG TPA: hypothetical protein DCZ97_14220 [Syntrophus sp. (in: bacteria)]|nr:MAG: hypothetical protein A2X92_05640 [Syntrophus sp. GWC2_56_31]HBB18087.1 hypothetical protein [Syntrophus sp. (in: bacteria)]